MSKETKKELKQSIQAVILAFATVAILPVIILVSIPFGIAFFWEIISEKMNVDPLAPMHNPNNYE